MEFEEKAKIRIEHWLKHTADHLDEYEKFTEALENHGHKATAQHIREMTVLTAKCTKCLEHALLTLNEGS